LSPNDELDTVALSCKGLVLGAVMFGGCKTVDEIMKKHKLDRLDVEVAVKELIDKYDLKVARM